MWHEQVGGAAGGLHVAVYACEMGDMGDVYLGYYKVFRSQPKSFFDVGHLLLGTVEGLSSTPGRAMNHAHDVAVQQIRAIQSRVTSLLASAAMRAKVPRLDAETVFAPLEQ